MLNEMVHLHIRLLVRRETFSQMLKLRIHCESAIFFVLFIQKDAKTRNKRVEYPKRKKLNK